MTSAAEYMMKSFKRGNGKKSLKNVSVAHKIAIWLSTSGVTLPMMHRILLILRGEKRCVQLF